MFLCSCISVIYKIYSTYGLPLVTKKEMNNNSLASQRLAYNCDAGGAYAERRSSHLVEMQSSVEIYVIPITRMPSGMRTFLKICVNQRYPCYQRSKKGTRKGCPYVCVRKDALYRHCLKVN